MAKDNAVLFCALDPTGRTHPPSEASVALRNHGIALGQGSLQTVLAGFKADVVWFEFHHQVRKDYLAAIDQHCPRARLVVDSVDVHYARLQARATASGKADDLEVAERVKTRELAAYAKCDVVIVVSEDDGLLVRQELPDAIVEVIPNLHEIPDYPSPDRRREGELVFIGGFKHDPNVDAVQYFCSQVLPLIARTRPEVRLTVIGSHPPPEVKALASHTVDVVGFVPETAPYLRRACISIAPLRYGGGLKGKVGEAMSFGVPVVTTSFGAQGFGLVPGRELLVGDSAQEFADHVVALLEDAAYRQQIGRRGYDFVSETYSVRAVEMRLTACLDRVASMGPRRIPWSARIGNIARGLYRRHLAWRISQP